MSRSSLELIRHILVETDYVMSQISTLDYEAFIQSETLKRAFVRSIEIIGEATKNVSQEIRELDLGIEWRKVAGMRISLFMNTLGLIIKLFGMLPKTNFPSLIPG